MAKKKKARPASDAKPESCLRVPPTPQRPRPGSQAEEKETEKTDFLTALLVWAGMIGLYGVSLFAASAAPAVLRAGLESWFGERRGAAWVILQSAMWGQPWVLIWAALGIPALLWTARFWFRHTRAAGVFHKNNWGPYGVMVIVFLVIPWIMLTEENPIGAMEGCRRYLRCLAAGETEVYEGRIASADVCGGFGMDLDSRVFWVLRSEAWSEAERIQVFCPLPLGDAAGLYRFFGGQATGRDSRRFRIVYLPNSGLVTVLGVLE